MRKSLNLLVILMLAFVAQTAMAAGVYTVHVQNAIANTKAAKSYNANIEKKYKKDKEELERLDKQLRSMQEKLQKDSKTMKEDQLRDKAADFNKKRIDLATKAKKYEESIKKAQGNFLKKMSPKLEKALAKVAKKKKADSILNRQSSVIWIDPKYDVTTDVTKAMDAIK